MITVDRDEALRLMGEAVAEKGAEHTVDVCTYFHEDGQPNCIVGNVLSRLGKTEDDLSHKDAQWMGPQVPKPNGVAFKTVVVDGIEFTDEARHILRLAQIVQDGGRLGDSSGVTWGEALAVAKAVRPE